MPSNPSSQDEAAAKRVGHLLSGKWKLERLLGVGGMAAVYAAVHRNGMQAAIKLFKPGFIADPGMHQRFLREGYLANRVGHPAVVRVFDDHVDETDGSAYLVMELIEGESLQQRLERHGPLSTIDVLSVADQLLDVLEVAHARGVVHRDLKPENIIVLPSGQLRVLDFGIARDIDGDPASTYGGLTIGTPAYMAPEQALGKNSQIDGRTDLYAVGAMLFGLLTGEHIHKGETIQELVMQAAWFRARKLRTVWADAPSELAAVVDRACAYEREERFADAKAMREAVQRLLEAEPRTARAAALRQGEDVALPRAWRTPVRSDAPTATPGPIPSPPVTRPLPFEHPSEATQAPSVYRDVATPTLQSPAGSDGIASPRDPERMPSLGPASPVAEKEVGIEVIRATSPRRRVAIASGAAIALGLLLVSLVHWSRGPSDRPLDEAVLRTPSEGKVDIVPSAAGPATTPPVPEIANALSPVSTPSIAPPPETTPARSSKRHASAPLGSVGTAAAPTASARPAQRDIGY